MDTNGGVGIVDAVDGVVVVVFLLVLGLVTLLFVFLGEREESV